MTDDDTTMAEEMSINEEQANSPGISDWVSVREIGAQQNFSTQPATASNQDVPEE